MNPPRGRRSRAASFVLLCIGTAALAQAQTKTPDIPRGPDGKPDLSGIWQVLNSAAWDLQDHSGSLGVPPGQGVVEGGQIPYRPEAAKKKQDKFPHRATEDP